MHMKLMKFVDPATVKLSKFDDYIYRLYMRYFKNINIEVLKEEDLKTEVAKTRWRPFCEHFKGALTDYNFGTLLRMDCKEDYSGRARRLDSCRTEASSGANTPNPLSPEALDRVEDIVVATRPSTPQPESGEVTPSTPGVPTPMSDASSAVTPATPSVSAATPLTPGSVPSSATPNTNTPTSSVPISSVPNLMPPTPLTSIPASLRGRRRTSSQTKSRDRNLSEASQHSQESSRSTSPWTEVEDRVETMPWEPRVFPLSEEEAKELEVDDRLMLPPSSQPPSQSSATVSAETSRATSRSSSVEAGEDSADPDWEEGEEDVKEELADDDPEYDPDRRERGKKPLVNY